MIIALFLSGESIVESRDQVERGEGRRILLRESACVPHQFLWVLFCE